MRKARTPLFLTALVLVLGSVALAADGIEVLNILPIGHGCLVESITHGAPAGSTMEAVMYVHGQPLVVDSAPIGPDGFSVVLFPDAEADLALVARGPGGEVLYLRYIKVEGILELDNS